MKNQITSVRHDAANLQAKKAIQQIQNWIEKKNPRIAASAKTKMIIECLIELTEERKFLAAS